MSNFNYPKPVHIGLTLNSDEKETILLNSVHYGVPQIRKRVIIIGVRKDLKFAPKDIYKNIVKTHYSPEMESKGAKNGLVKSSGMMSDSCRHCPADVLFSC